MLYPRVSILTSSLLLLVKSRNSRLHKIFPILFHINIAELTRGLFDVHFDQVEKPVHLSSVLRYLLATRSMMTTCSFRRLAHIDQNALTPGAETVAVPVLISVVV
jgi:hypothetical protein